MVLTGVWLAIAHPIVFLGLFAIFVILLLWLIPKVWRGLRTVLSRFGPVLDPGGR
jgi:hypothetical protein